MMIAALPIPRRPANLPCSTAEARGGKSTYNAGRSALLAHKITQPKSRARAVSQ